MKFKFIRQHDQMDCGPACLGMIARHYGKKYSLQYLRQRSFLTKDGVSVSGISHAAIAIGLESTVYKLTLNELKILVKQQPCVLHWNQNHFIILISITIRKNKISFKIADPGYGIMTLSEVEFLKHWISTDNEGIVISFKPSKDFMNLGSDDSPVSTVYYIKQKIKIYRGRIFTIFISILLTSCCTLIFPFITQAVVDKGIDQKNLDLVTTLLIAHAFIFVGATIIDVVRNWTTLYLGTKLNINIISDFLRKVIQVPITFFESKQKGDFNQRILDQHRIETFLTTQSIITLFSVINFTIFLGVLMYYNFTIVCTYFFLTALAIGWSLLFIKKLKSLDYHKFQLRSENQDTIYEFVDGIEEIKLNNLEEYKTTKWEALQIKLFGINIRALKTVQFQTVGFDVINQLKNILVTYFAARGVINGSLTLGAMLSISYIVGAMNSPISQLILFIRGFQEAKLSLERLNEVQNVKEEGNYDGIQKGLLSNNLDSKLQIRKVSFQYGSPTSKKVLKDLTFDIPYGQTTAIVGGSGSGKTTLLKLLLKFYHPIEGKIVLGNEFLNSIHPNEWRSECGVVLQDGYLFSDTIEQNIVCGDPNIDSLKLTNATRIANIDTFINELPLGLNTKIGSAGNNLSGGQKQRILIARAVYKDPRFIFFDEATSALDAKNEKIIHDNLQEFFKGRTVVIIAHRLSTVKKADQIIVLKNGELVERGSHGELIKFRNEYYDLVKNQLELGN
ncbi:peptidase domain-containing ABC transporter [Elizabethkingia anophelis]|nr:peptidase domain-containing ABC transporter [Elizabethkingia anophelis]MCT3994399.1 peptidase domain-containing ABC transporter [Elizabethkingia anophelis]MCT3997889.1 peptidase domain-containing ABC transporter [Elizabethkingia anophelis]MCT4254934.1 peptidase domain-containing ABC transporter [Elizabethkingia anophelis]